MDKSMQQQFSDVVQQVRTVILGSRERNEMSPVIALAFCLEILSGQ